MKPQRIKQVLVELASNDQLPLDMNNLDENIFQDQEQAEQVKSLQETIAFMANDFDFDKTKHLQALDGGFVGWLNWVISQAEEFEEYHSKEAKRLQVENQTYWSEEKNGLSYYEAVEKWVCKVQGE